MAFNGSGTFLRVRNWVNDASAGIKIRADRHDSEDDNFASGLSQCITKDGQTTVTANLPMATYRHTGVGAAAARTDYARYDQLQDGNTNWAVAGGTADAITATYSPSISTLVDGQLFFLRASAANATTTPTFSPDGQTARTIVKNGGNALAENDIRGSGAEIILRYNLANTRYELLNPNSLSSNQDNVFDGVNDFQGVVKVTGNQLQLSKGADIASATALPLLTDGNFFDVTGTTTITSIATSGKVGTKITLQFDGVLTITHHSSDLILPTGANIVTAAGDVAEFVEYASGDWVCTNYRRANGKALAETGVTTDSMQTATGSETAIDFTSIPSGVKKIILMFSDVSKNATGNYLVQIGDSGGIESSGYSSEGAIIDGVPSVSSSTSGYVIGCQSASDNVHGHMMLTLIDAATNRWVSSHTMSGLTVDYISTGAGTKSLSSTLDRLRITSAAGTSTFDSGSKFNISYEY